jgi:hypothetical protein
MQNVPAPCDESTATDVTFDGRASRDSSGRPFKKLVWSQDSADVILSAAIDTANSAANGAGSPQLVIPGASIAQISSGVHTIKLVATNYLDVSGEDTVTFTKQQSGATPVVSVLGGSTQKFKVAKGISITSQLVAASVCSSQMVRMDLQKQTACLTSLASSVLYYHGIRMEWTIVGSMGLQSVAMPCTHVFPKRLLTRCTIVLVWLFAG